MQALWKMLLQVGLEVLVWLSALQQNKDRQTLGRGLADPTLLQPTTSQKLKSFLELFLLKDDKSLSGTNCTQL